MQDKSTLSSFPFSAGVPLQKASEYEHADGTITDVSFTDFCFANPEHELWLKTQETPWIPPQVPPSHLPIRVPSATTNDESVAHLISSLQRDGAVILQNASPSDVMKLNNFLSCHPDCHPLCTAECFNILALPDVMSVCDGVIGRQILQVDQRLGLEELVFPPSLFTDELTIQSIPWELQDCSYDPYPRQTAGLRRSCDYGVNRFNVACGVDDTIEVIWSLREDCEEELLVEEPCIDATNKRSQHVRVAIGSHLLPKHCSPNPDTVVEWRGEVGEVLIILGNTLHEVIDLNPGNAIGADSEMYLSEMLFLSYHAAYLRQRSNLYTICPPAEAVTYPPHIARLMGYAMPGPVLNKLYCGAGSSEILPAYRAYKRAIDWAGAAHEQEGADRWRSLCGNSSYTAVGHVSDNDDHERRKNSGYDPITLSTIGPWVTRLPALKDGLVTVDHTDPHVFELLLAAMLRDGCVVLGNAVTKEHCNAVLQQLQPYSDDVKGKAVGSLPARSSASWAMSAHPIVLQLCDAVLGEQRLALTPPQFRPATSRDSHVHAATGPGSKDGLPYQIHICVTIPKQPGSVCQQLHRDGDLSLLDIPRIGRIDHSVIVIWALDGDFTEERGTTRVVPGSHQWPAARQVMPEESVPAVMAQGSVLIYTGRTMHGAGHNVTSSPRIAMNVAYNCACLKQEENQFVAVPPAIAQSVPPQIKALLGYE